MRIAVQGTLIETKNCNTNLSTRANTCIHFPFHWFINVHPPSEYQLSQRDEQSKRFFIFLVFSSFIMITMMMVKNLQNVSLTIYDVITDYLTSLCFSRFFPVFQYFCYSINIVHRLTADRVIRHTCIPRRDYRSLTPPQRGVRVTVADRSKLIKATTEPVRGVEAAGDVGQSVLSFVQVRLLKDERVVRQRRSGKRTRCDEHVHLLRLQRVGGVAALLCDETSRNLP